MSQISPEPCSAVPVKSETPSNAMARWVVLTQGLIRAAPIEDCEPQLYASSFLYADVLFSPVSLVLEGVLLDNQAAFSAGMEETS